MYMRRYFILGILAAVPLLVAAQDSATVENVRVLTLKECMRYALEHSADIVLKDADISDDRIARRDAILSAFTPSVSAQSNLSSSFGRAIDPETNTYLSTTSLNNSYGVSAGIYLFNGFKAVNNLKIAKTAQLMGLDEKRQEEDRICLAVMEAYANVLYYMELSEILSDEVETSEESLHLAKRQEQLGQKSYADVVQMEADLADRKYQYINAENSLNDAYMTLKDIMFWPVDDTLTIAAVSGNIKNQAAAPVSGGGGAEVSEIIETAGEFVPEVSIARANVETARLGLRTAKWQLMPSLSINGGWSTSYYTYPGQKGYTAAPFWSQFSNNGGEYVQLALSIPIYNGLARHSEISKRKNQLKRSEAEYDRTLRTLESEVRRAVQDRDGAMAAYVQAERRAEVQEEAFRLNGKKLEQGLISTIEYKAASDEYLKSRTEKMNALLKYYIKKSVVDYYRGIPYLEQEL